MFERIQAYPEYMIDDRKRMHMVSTLNSVMNEKQGRRRKTGRLSQQLLNGKSSRAVRIRLGTSLSQERKKGETKEKYHARLPPQVPASSVSKVSRWQRKTGAEGRSARPRRQETSRRHRDGNSEHGRRK